MSNDKLTSEFDKTYQKRLINQIIMEQKFASVLLPILDPLYFDDEIIKLIIRTLIDAYVKDDTVLNFETLITRVLTHRSFNTPIKKERLVKLVEEIKTIDSNDFNFVRERALTFCKQQELRKAAKKVLKIADSVNPESYYECETIIKDALEKGNEDDNGIDVAHNLENVLSEDFRDPIPTGIKGLDECMGGGLSKKEVALVIAPSGVGKTTLTTKIANEAFNAGKNVVQLFFEDTEEQIQRKHFTCWTGVESKDLFSRRDDVIKTVKEKTDRQNKLILLKLPSFGTTMRSINQALKKIIANGTPIDMVILDYIDCVQADKSAKDVHEAEGLSMRQFETMVSELNIAGWVATQGNRDSMSAEIVQASQTGGSIKKVQIGHFVMSIAKTLEQREEGVANIAILKSRFGKDGVTFNDCVFDNATMTIDTSANAMGYGDWQQAKQTQVQNTIINALK
jgi:replicative DNA helicase